MSSMRGRVVKQGGVAWQPAGAAPRTSDLGIVRPAFVVQGGRTRPTYGGFGGAAASLFDLSSVASWRLIAVGIAVAYVVGFHVTIGRTRLGLGPAR